MLRARRVGAAPAARKSSLVQQQQQQQQQQQHEEAPYGGAPKATQEQKNRASARGAQLLGLRRKIHGRETVRTPPESTVSGQTEGASRRKKASSRGMIKSASFSLAALRKRRLSSIYQWPAASPGSMRSLTVLAAVKGARLGERDGTNTTGRKGRDEHDDNRGAHLGRLLQIARDPETAINAKGDGVVWETEFEAAWMHALRVVFECSGRADVALAFMAVRAMHAQCDVEFGSAQEQMFWASGKLHADEIVVPLTRETLLMRLLNETPPPLGTIERLLKVASSQLAINPRKRNAAGQTALHVFLARLCEEGFFHDFVTLGENPSFTKEVIGLLVHMEKVGFFACIDHEELVATRTLIVEAVVRWKTHFRSLRSDANIRDHVESLRQMQPPSRATLHAQNKLARSFQRALKFHAEEVTSRGTRVIALLDHVFGMVSARLDKMAATPIASPVGSPIASPRFSTAPCSPRQSSDAKWVAETLSTRPERWQMPSATLGILVFWELARRAIVLMQTCEGALVKSRECRSQEQFFAIFGILFSALLTSSAISASWRIRAHRLALFFAIALALQSSFQLWEGSLVDGLRVLIYVGIAYQCHEAATEAKDPLYQELDQDYDASQASTAVA